MSSPGFINIKLEIQIPTAGGTPSIVLATPEVGKQRSLEQRELGDPLDNCPKTNDSVPVHLTNGSGSGSVGTICGWVRFGENPPNLVLAQAIPKDDTLLNSLGNTPNISNAVQGNPNADATLWTWNGYNGEKEIPGATIGIDNYFVIWAWAYPGPWTRKAVAFTAFAGTTDPCGAPGGNNCFPASGSNNEVLQLTRSAGKIYPAIWCVTVSGFSVVPLAIFNATWALRQVTGTSHPTWDNAADGKLSPSIQLKLCPKNGWELGLRFQETHVTYSSPCQGNHFGPLKFVERHETVKGLGTIVLPTILVSGM